MPGLKLTLPNALFGKSIVETLLVGALAVVTFINVFPPTFHGWGELTETGIAGWAVNNAAPSEHVEVQLFVDGRLVATASANQSRQDVKAAGWAQDEWHGYTFTLANLSSGYHGARVYALHDSGAGNRKSLQLLGDPIFFRVDENGKLTKAPDG